MTGIIGAMKIEIEALNAQMENRQTRTVSGIEFTSGTLCGREGDRRLRNRQSIRGDVRPDDDPALFTG